MPVLVNSTKLAMNLWAPCWTTKGLLIHMASCWVTLSFCWLGQLCPLLCRLYTETPPACVATSFEHSFSSGKCVCTKGCIYQKQSRQLAWSNVSSIVVATQNYIEFCKKLPNPVTYYLAVLVRKLSWVGILYRNLRFGCIHDEILVTKCHTFCHNIVL